MAKPIYILNGPNLDLLGKREPEIYGAQSLADIAQALEDKARELGLEIVFRQSNHEGELVDWVREAGEKGAALIINAAAYTHSSVALLDAILASGLPCIEVHLSNIYRREAFRHHSYISKAATGVICGLGSKGYELALLALAERLEENR